MDGIIGYDYWMVYFLPNMGSVTDHSSQGRFFLSFIVHQIWGPLSTIPRRGVFFLFFLRVLVLKRSYWVNKCDFWTRIFEK